MYEIFVELLKKHNVTAAQVAKATTDRKPIRCRK